MTKLCQTCGGSGVVDDGEITHYSCGIEFECGPIKCCKDCPDCAEVGEDQITLPCPVCGSNNISDGETLTEFKNGVQTVQSQCEDCNVEGPHAILKSGEIDFGDVKAIAAWNSWVVNQRGQQ